MNCERIFTLLDIWESYLLMHMTSESTRIHAIFTSNGNYQVKRSRYIADTSKILRGMCFFRWSVRAIPKASPLCSIKIIRCRININAEKSLFFVTPINYFSYKINNNGLTKTLEKVEAVTKAAKPSKVFELGSSLGLVYYYGKFVEDLATKINLYRLLDNG